MGYGKPIDSEVKSIRKIYDVEKPYFIDIYQREYKWEAAQTIELLTDIERNFLIKRPYFLNTYLVSSINNNSQKSIVDGQQRLTTILLILIRIRNLIKSMPNPNNIFSVNKLAELINKTDDNENTIGFVITNENRQVVLNALYNETTPECSDETQENLYNNYKEISRYYESFSSKNIDMKEYITYLLDSVYTVELTIIQDEDTATIFEVVNARGLALKPYEILKAKLLGVLKNDQKEKANLIWSRMLNNYFHKNVDIDRFFRDYLRARYHLFDAQDKDYHKLFDTNTTLRKAFGNLSNSKIIFEKITVEIVFYSELYLQLRHEKKFEFVEYNKYLGQDIQYQLCLSAISTVDNEVTQSSKVDIISKNYEKWHVILNLWNIYDSRDTNERYKNIIMKIKDISNIMEIQSTIDTFNIQYIKQNENYQHVDSVSKLFINRKDFYNNNQAFTRYILMRIELELKKYTGQPTIIENFQRFCEFAGKKANAYYSIHVEHIYAWNENNILLFDNNETLFMDERNKLGMVLLLLGMQNQSSNNETYKDKLDCYSKSNFIWNELLSGHVDDIIYKKLPEELQKTYYITPNKDGSFPREHIEDRQQVIFNIIKFIWNF